MCKKRLTILVLFCSITFFSVIDAANQATLRPPFNTVENQLPLPIETKNQQASLVLLPKPNFNSPATTNAQLPKPKFSITNLASASQPQLAVTATHPLTQTQIDIPLPNLIATTPIHVKSALIQQPVFAITDKISAPFHQSTLIWSKKMSSGSVHQHLLLTPTLFKNLIVTVGDDGKISAAIDSNGQYQWSTQSWEPVTTSIVSGSNSVFAGTDGGRLLAYSPNEKKIIFKKQLSSTVLAAPVVDDKNVYVKTLDDHLYAFEQHNGHVLWAYSRAAPSLTNHQSSSPVIAGDKLVAGLASGRVVALTLAKGSVIWDQALAYAEGDSDIARMVDIDVDPVVGDARVFAVNIKGHLGVLRLDDGHELWSQEEGPVKGLAYAQQTLYLTKANGEVVALNPEFGTVKWHNDAYKGEQLTAPVIVGNDLVIANNDGKIYWLQQADGKQVNQLSIGNTVIAKPLLGTDAIYVQTLSGRVAKIV